MEYVFPKFSDQAIEGAAKLHKFGYTVSSTIEGYTPIEYTAPVELVGSTDIALKFTDDVYVSPAVNLGFSFPYYGKTYDKVYITSFGGVMFNLNEDPFRSPISEKTYGVPGTGLIAAYGSQLQMGPESKVEYAKVNGEFVVSFKNVLAVVYGSEYAPVSFRIILSPNGDIRILYDDYDAPSFFQEGSTLFCGINDPEMNDCLTITSAAMSDYWGTQEPTADNTRFRLFGSGTEVYFQAPQQAFVTALAPAYGLVSPGESVEVKATVTVSDDLNAGSIFNNIAIVSNDPTPSVSAVRFNAVVSEQGKEAVAYTEKTDIDFGNTFRTSDLKVPVTVSNTGHNDLTVTAAAATGGLTVAGEYPANIKPGASLDILVTVPTATEGDIAGVLTVSTSAGDLAVNIHGKIIGCPSVVLTPESIDETLEAGTPLTKTIEIANDGNEPLEYAVVGDILTKVVVPDKNDTDVSYTYTASADNKAKFEWVDIETTGLGTQNAFRYYNQHDYVAVDLPFEFPFYGKKYNKMYIYNTGFVSFTERHDDRIWPEPPAEFPQGTIFTNIIAPYWGLHSMNTTKTAGTYHYVTDDRAVVSFMEYGNSMNIGVDFQLILEKDGSFKFQYKANDEYAELMGTFGLAGISDADGEKSVRLPDRYIAFGNAVQFTPVKLNTLAPGQKDAIEVEIDTDRMAGSYEGTVSISTNVPQHESISVPVQLTLTGTPKPVIPENVEVTNVLGYRSTDVSNPLVQMGACYDAPFKVSNEGKAAFTVMSVSYESPMIEDEWGSMPAFMLMANLPEIDWMTGEPTGNYMWQMVEPDFFSPVEVGSRPLEFSIPMMEGEYWMTPGEYSIPVNIVYGNSLEDENPQTATVNVKFVVTPAPVMLLDKEEIRVEGAADDLVTVETLNIANYGEYKLDYTLKIDPTGVGEQTEDIGGGIAPARLNATPDAGQLVSADGKRLTLKADGDTETNPYDVPSDFEFARGLYYDAMPGNTNAYNYGSNSLNDVYKASVHFTAPADGFNVSHIYMPVTIESAKNVTINIDLVEGDDPAGEETIGHGSLFVESQTTQAGRFYVIPLDRPVYMNPGEDFCVVVTYPEGMRFPAYLCAKEEPVTAGRYLGWTQANDWFDVAQEFEGQYGSLGYILSCLETQAGEPWIKLLDTPTENSVQPEAAATVKVQLSAASARLEKGNKAVLVIKTNDPMQPIVDFPIMLDKNGTPVIEVPTSAIYAKEGEVTNVAVAVSDSDGDALTVSIDDALGISVLSAAGNENVVENSDGTLTVSGTSQPVSFAVAISPEYGDHGSYSFNLTVSDPAGHQAKAAVPYHVDRVNRAPEPLEVPAIEVEEGQMSAPFVFAQLFNEPDGQDMSYSLSMPDQSVAQAFLSDNAVVFYGIKEGNAKATVTATDEEGAQSEATVDIVVKKDSGVEDVTTDSAQALIALVENPVSETLSLRSGVSGKATVDIFATGGAKVVSVPVVLSTSEVTTVNVSALSAGYYLLRVTTADGLTVTHRLIVL